MKKFAGLLIILIVFMAVRLASAQQVIVTDDAAYAGATGAMLDVKSTTKGFIVPRMTTAQKTTLGGTSPVNGVIIYDTDLKSFYYWENSTWNQIAASGLNLTNVKFGDASNYSTFEADGTLLMVGNATVWEDIRVAIALRGSGGNSPTFSSLEGGLYAYKFSGTGSQVNEIFFEIQMPHSWAEGTTIYPHVHWVSNGYNTTDAVTWGLEYDWENIGGSFGGTTTTITSDVLSTGYKVQNINNIGAGIVGTGKNISSMMLCRLYRSGNTDPNNDDCFLLAFDIHYQINTIGSRQILTK
ncbi:MAG: hypothetical protein WCO02_10345 [Bacteroidota bacterium]